MTNVRPESGTGTATLSPRPDADTFRFDRRELAGAIADIGVLLPIAVTLIVANSLSATAVLLPAGLLYVTAALVYRLPVPVQPLKAFSAIAIAKGLGSDEIAAGALLVGVIFIVLARTGLIDYAARAFPKPLIRGVQLTVGLLFLKIAWMLVTNPPEAFAANALAPGTAVLLAALALGLAITLKRHLISLALVGVGVAVMLVQAGGDISLGPSAITVPSIDLSILLTALTVLVIPQVPLSFANSCVAMADVARTYFGERATGVRPGRLATTLGVINLLAGGISGMPVCHGAGGMTAHRAFGARSGGAPLMIGAVLIVVALAVGSSLAVLLTSFPLPVLAGLLAAAGVLHIGLLRDLGDVRGWAVALAVGVVGFEANLVVALGLGLAAWWIPVWTARLWKVGAPSGAS